MAATSPNWPFVATGALLVALGVLLVIVFWQTTTSLSPKGLQEFAQAGDFFGGFLNPLLTFVTFLAVIYSLHLQNSEMKQARIQFERSADALADQNSQSSFYQLLEIHNDLVGAFEATDPVSQNRCYGRDAFRVIYSNMRRLHKEKEKRFPKGDKRKIAQLVFGKIYREEPELATYFRYLYNTFCVVEKFPDNQKYIKLLRSILSNQELLILFYNSTVSEYGKNFQRLAIEHKLFDNMPAHLLHQSHSKFIDSRAFGPGGYEGKLALLGPGVLGDLREPKGPPA